MVVIDGADNSEARLSYIDPLDGQEYWITYDNFCNGGVHGGNYDQTVWYRITY